MLSPFRIFCSESKRRTPGDGNCPLEPSVSESHSSSPSFPFTSWSSSTSSLSSPAQRILKSGRTHADENDSSDSSFGPGASPLSHLDGDTYHYLFKQSEGRLTKSADFSPSTKGKLERPFSLIPLTLEVEPEELLCNPVTLMALKDWIRSLS